MQKQTVKEHFLELKRRLSKVCALFGVSFLACYYFSAQIYQVLLSPLKQANPEVNQMIYTSLTEGFFTYLKLSAFAGFLITIPFLVAQIYLFIKPGLYSAEKKLIGLILFSSPILFLLGGVFVFYYVMPKAWHFFLSFEDKNAVMPIILEAKISEYLSLVMQLIIAFGLAFQLPIIIVILDLLGIICAAGLQQKRRLAIVVNFIVAGILTPPDVLSQFALAIPLLLLYEFSIVMCKWIENRGTNVRHQMDTGK